MSKYNPKITSIRSHRKGYYIRIDIYQKFKDCMMYEGYLYIDTTLDIEDLKKIFKGGKYEKENIRKLTKLEGKNNG